MEYNLSKIDNLLTKGFSSEELLKFTLYVEPFQELYDELLEQENKKSFITRKIIEYAERKRLMENLLAWAKSNNKNLFEELEPFYLELDSTDESNIEKIYLNRKSTYEYDVFISHASEDKVGFVRPLANMLIKTGVRVWYDEFSLKWGDSISESIAKGLNNSEYGIVVISKNFINKGWTRHELMGLWTREVGNKKVILPIWHNITKEEVGDFDPALANKKAIVIDTSNFKDIREIVKEIINFINKS